MFRDFATARGDEVALDDSVRSRTWVELQDRATRIARLLTGELGLGPDDHAAVLMGNRAEAVEIVLGAWLAGVWLTPINHHLVGDEVRYVLEDSRARVVFTDDEYRALLPAAGGCRVLSAGDELESAIAAAQAEPMPLDGPPGATMIYTSGTTGRPKGVKRARPATLDQSLSAVRAYGASIGLDGEGPHLVTGPLYHAAPLLFAVYDMINGAPVIVMPRWDERRALELIEQRRVRHVHFVPTMFVRLLKLEAAVRERFDHSSLELVLHGAAPIGPAVKREMIGWWGEILVEYWGGSESGVATLVGSREWLDHPGTVGRATASYEVFAVDDGRRLPAGETGALYCRHKQVDRIFEYHGAPEKTEESYLDKASFTLGDVGFVDEAGYVYLADRKSNMIISGGVNIYPAEIEAVLCEHPLVADVAVFGIPDEEWGESVKAAVQLVDGEVASETVAAEILAFAREHLAGYKVPRSIDFETELPRNPAGKLLVRKLRDPYWRGHDRSI